MTAETRLKILEHLKTLPQSYSITQLGERIASLSPEGLQQTDESTIWFAIEAIRDKRVFKVVTPVIKAKKVPLTHMASESTDPDEFPDNDGIAWSD